MFLCFLSVLVDKFRDISFLQDASTGTPSFRVSADSAVTVLSLDSGVF